jgi:hypothetical protein
MTMTIDYILYQKGFRFVCPLPNHSAYFKTFLDANAFKIENENKAKYCYLDEIYIDDIW